MSVGSQIALTLFFAFGIVGFLALMGGYLTVRIALSESGRSSAEITKLMHYGLKRTCPVCGQGKMFRSHFSMHDNCPHCGTRFWQSEGAGLGSIIIEYSVAIATAMICWAVCFLVGLPGAVQMSLAIAAAVVAVIVVAPWSLSFWLVFLYITGDVVKTIPETKGIKDEIPTTRGKPRAAVVPFPGYRRDNRNMPSSNQDG